MLREWIRGLIRVIVLSSLILGNPLSTISELNRIISKITEVNIMWWNDCGWGGCGGWGRWGRWGRWGGCGGWGCDWW